MANTPTVFVTSATGAQGSALCRELLNLGWNVRASTRDVNAASPQALKAAGVQFVQGGWDDEDVLKEGLKGCDKLYLCLFPQPDFEVLPRQAALIARLAKEAGVKHAIASTTQGCFLVEDHGIEQPHKLAPLFEAHCHCKKRLEKTIAEGGFEHWTVLRPGLFMANFLQPKIEFFCPDVKTGSWTVSMTDKTQLGLIDHVDIARFATQAFKDPATFDGKYLPCVSEELPVQEALDQLSEAIGDGRSIKALFMTEAEIDKAQADGSWLVFSSERSIRHMSDYTNMDELQRLLPGGLTSFKTFLAREKEGIKETYLS